MTPDLTTVVDEEAVALNVAIVEEHGLLDDAIKLSCGPHVMWRDRVECTLKTITDPAGMSASVWCEGRPTRWLLTSHPDGSRIGLTVSGSALALYAVPPRDRPRRVLVPCPGEVTEAFENQD